MAYLNSSSEKIDQPSCITKNLFEHQKKAIYAMTKLERTNKLKIDVSRLSEPFSNRSRYYTPDVANSSFWPPETPVRILMNSNMGIYSDKVGAGKTLAMISLIAHNNDLKKKEYSFISSTESGYYYSPFGISASVILHDQYKFIDSNLILVPHSLINQWKKHLELYKDLSLIHISEPTRPY